jgi:hypothetical protein
MSVDHSGQLSYRTHISVPKTLSFSLPSGSALFDAVRLPKVSLPDSGTGTTRVVLLAQTHYVESCGGSLSGRRVSIF